MDPEVVLTVVALGLFAVVVWFVGLPADWPRARSCEPERVAWWRLVGPLFAAVLVFAFLLGWVAQEPDPADERVGLVLPLLAVFSAGVALRASVRAWKALRLGTNACIPIGTIGLFSPRIIVSVEFQDCVSEDVLAAALAHEAAHERRRDPLRIWLAQLAADLQWPVPGTARRFSGWLLALESDRDDDALASGVAAEDLAEAVLTAARLHRATESGVCASVEGSGEGIAWRVRRLLSGTVSSECSRPGRSWGAALSCLALVAAAIWLGIHFGDAVLGVLPGTRP